METPANLYKTPEFNEVYGDPALARIIEILRKAREEDELEDLENRVEAARRIA